jgi:hypothetical protein
MEVSKVNHFKYSHVTKKYIDMILLQALLFWVLLAQYDESSIPYVCQALVQEILYFLLLKFLYLDKKFEMSHFGDD